MNRFKVEEHPCENASGGVAPCQWTHGRFCNGTRSEKTTICSPLRDGTFLTIYVEDNNGTDGAPEGSPEST